MTGITREKSSQVAADFLGGQSRYLGTYYKTFTATDSQGREWKFTFDGSIAPEKRHLALSGISLRSARPRTRTASLSLGIG